MFAVGDKVVYPMHGVGVIENIENHKVLGESNKYYMLKFINGKMLAMVPVTSCIEVGLRCVVGKREYEKALDYFSNDDYLSENPNWNQRYRDNMEKLKSGDFLSVAEVVKALKKRNDGKGLSSGERKIFLTAKQVLISELMCVSGNSYEYYEELLGI
ncbi:MAG: CarD family transcriptional regulator [Clostridiales bacterium]|nr:CarD family transcriptional regulator [Clostridiales bacterium]